MANQHTSGVTDEERAEIRRLHAEGKGRNEIARLTGRSMRCISVQAGKMGLSFDRTMTEEATRARKADLEERRVILAEALQGDAERLTEQLWEEHWVFNFGGKDNTYEKRLLPEPPADAKKNLMAAAGIAIEKSSKLVPPDRGDQEGLAAVDAWLRGMIGGE
ncbi:MAG: helix-turn-helix domain-containing protein [Streptomyces sp.]|nr:helix-turn-helix domain-containing protein [Streptomyces sp.]